MKFGGELLGTVANMVKSDGDSVTVCLVTVEKAELNVKQQTAPESIMQNAAIAKVKPIVSHAKQIRFMTGHFSR